jgi:hypothetical protein
LLKSEGGLDIVVRQKTKPPAGGAPGDKAKGPREDERVRRKIGLNKRVSYVFPVKMVSEGKGRMPGASCDSGQALEKAQNGNG